VATALEWMFSGNAIFHVHNAQGVEFVYKIVLAELDCNCDGNPHCANCNGTGKSRRFFASLVRNNHPALEGKYGYIGEATPNTPRIRTTTKSRWAEDSIPFKTLVWALEVVHGKKTWPKGYGLVTRRCGYCGEQLRDDYDADFGYCVGGCKPPEERKKEEPKKVDAQPPAQVQQPKKKVKKDEPACTCGVPADALTTTEAVTIAEGINFFSGGNYTATVHGTTLIVKDRQGREERASTYTQAEAIQNRICK